MKNFHKSLMAIGLAFGVGTSALAANTVAWQSYLFASGSTQVVPMAMTEDDDGYIYVAATTVEADSNLVVMKIDPSDGSLVSSQEFGNGDDQVAADITFGCDGKLYALGTSQDGSNYAHLYVVCLDTSLSSQWDEYVMTKDVNNHDNRGALGYRISTKAYGGTTEVYATANVYKYYNAAVDLTDPAQGKAIFYAQLTAGGGSGSTIFAHYWDGGYTAPHNLYGGHAISDGLVIVTEKDVTSSSLTKSKEYYVKVDRSSGTVAWEASPITSHTSPVSNHTHKLAQTMVHCDTVYTSLAGNFPSGLSTPPATSYDIISWADCSGGSAPGFSHSAYANVVATGGFEVSDNQGLGVVYWACDVYGVGHLSLSTGSEESPHKSWLRTTGISIYDISSDLYSDTQTAMSFVPSANQRCFDASSGEIDMLGLARGLTSNTFWFLSEKWGSGRADGVITLTSGYTFWVGFGNVPRQVLASKVSNSVYTLISAVNSSQNYSGLVKVTR